MTAFFVFSADMAHILYRGVYMEKLKIYTICSITLICVFLFGGLVYTAFDDTAAVPAAADSSDNAPVIVIDAGHGGEDSGAVANGLLEKDINLSIALKLRDMLRLSGYKVVMTREEDISIYDDTAATTREKKNSDLKNRVSIINENKNNILVSIHQNKFEQEKYSGYQYLFGAVDASLLGGTYRVYLVTEKDGAWAAYEAFPVYEEEKLGAAGSCDSGWSAYVKEETIAGAKLYLAVESEGRLMMGALPEER